MNLAFFSTSRFHNFAIIRLGLNDKKFRKKCFFKRFFFKRFFFQKIFFSKRFFQFFKKIFFEKKTYFYLNNIFIPDLPSYQNLLWYLNIIVFERC